MSRISTISSTHHPVVSALEPFDLKAHAAASKPPIELELIEANSELKKLGDDFMKAVLAHLKRENRAMSRSLQEQITHLTNQAEGLETQKLWSLFSTIATAVLSLFGLVAGAQARSAYVVAAGAASLANTLITHYDGWKWMAETLASENEEAKANIRILMPLTMTLMSLGLGLRGAHLAGAGNPEIIQAFQNLERYTQGALLAGQAYNTYAQGERDVEVLSSEAQFNLHNKQVKALSDELEAWLKLTREISSLSKQSVKQAIHATSAAAGG